MYLFLSLIYAWEWRACHWCLVVGWWWLEVSRNRSRRRGSSTIFIIIIIIIIIIIYIICTYVAYSRPNGWTEWADIFCGHSWLASGFFRPKNEFVFNFFFVNFLLQIFVFHGQPRALQLVIVITTIT